MTNPTHNPIEGDSGRASPPPSDVGGRRASLPSGDMLGEFEIQEEIGRGGMGTVYKAWQRSLQRVVALKILAPHVSSSPNAIVRFQREAQAAAKLHHSHIVPIHAQGSSDGYYYYAMELINGVSLSAEIANMRALSAAADIKDIDETQVVSRSGQVSFDPGATVAVRPGLGDSEDQASEAGDSCVTLGMDVADHRGEDRFESIAEQIATVADALEYAHQRGVIHRDIKPHNLILSDDGRLQITDFGLARVLEQPGVTVTGEFIGSPLYMAPEQIAGDGTRVDGRADIYSLAATMYEWLTLRPPFPGRTRESVIGQVLRGEPCQPRTHDPSIPIDLETICLRAMERRPERRYQSAAEFRDDLRAYLAGRRIRARRAGLVTRARRFIGRHQTASLAVAAAAIAIAVMVYFWHGSTTIQQKQLALSERESRVEQKEARLNEQATQIGTLITDINERSAEGLIVQGAEFVSREVPGIVEKTANLTTENVGALLAENPASADVGTLAGIARRAVEDLLQASGPLDELRIQTMAIDPRLIVLRAAMDASDPVAAVNRIDPFVRDPSDYTARYLRTLLYGKAGQYELMAADAALLVQHPKSDAQAYVVQGLASLLANQWEPSAADCSRAIALDESLLVAWVVRGLARLQLSLTSEALGDFDAALALSPDSVVGRLGRAFACFIHMQHDAAIEDCSYVLALEPDNIDALVARGGFLRAAMRYDEALSDFGKAFNVRGISLSAKIRILGMLSSTRLSRDSQESTPGAARPTANASAGQDAADSVDDSTSPVALPGTASRPPPAGYSPLAPSRLAFPRRTLLLQRNRLTSAPRAAGG